MSTMHFNGATLSKIVWTLSPFYTVVLAYLLPLCMAARGRRFRDATALSWIFVICIMFFECYLLPFLMLRIDGSWDAEKIPDAMPGMGVIILFGWIPGVLMATLGSLGRWFFLRWKVRSELNNIERG